MTVKQPNIVPISQGKYRLEEDYQYQWDYLGNTYRLNIPAGFEYDGASIPRFAWSVLGMSRDGLHRAAALVHDYIYEFEGDVPIGAISQLDGNTWKLLFTTRVFSREEADKMFCRILRESNVPSWKRKVVYWAVRAFGWTYWN